MSADRFLAPAELLRRFAGGRLDPADPGAWGPALAGVHPASLPLCCQGRNLAFLGPLRRALEALGLAFELVPELCYDTIVAWSPLTFSMEGFAGPAPASLASFFWAPGWNSVQSINKFQEEIGGALMGGDPGVRLIAPELEPGRAEYPGAIPEAFAPRPGKWMVVPMYHIHGSDEMSMLSAAVAERAPAPHIALSPEDAQLLGLGEGEMAELNIDGEILVLQVAVHAALPKGVAGLPAGLPGMEPVEIPAWGAVARRVGS